MARHDSQFSFKKSGFARCLLDGRGSILARPPPPSCPAPPPLLRPGQTPHPPPLPRPTLLRAAPAPPRKFTPPAITSGPIGLSPFKRASPLTSPPLESSATPTHKMITV